MFKFSPENEFIAPAIVLIIEDFPLPLPPIIVFICGLKEICISSFSFKIQSEICIFLIIISG